MEREVKRDWAARFARLSAASGVCQTRENGVKYKNKITLDLLQKTGGRSVVQNKQYWGAKFGLLPSSSLGRIDRKNYGLCALLFVLVLMPISLLTKLSIPEYGAVPVAGPVAVSGAGDVAVTIVIYIALIIVSLFGILFIVSIPLWIRLHIRRLHDLGNDGWKIVFLFVPYLNAIFGLWLLLAKGQDGNNRFGEAVPNNAKFFDVVLGRKGFSPSIKEQTTGEPRHGTNSEKISMKTENIETLEKLFCYKCGSQIDLDSKFCSSCGSSLVIPPKME